MCHHVAPCNYQYAASDTFAFDQLLLEREKHKKKKFYKKQNIWLTFFVWINWLLSYMELEICEGKVKRKVHTVC